MSSTQSIAAVKAAIHEVTGLIPGRIAADATLDDLVETDKQFRDIWSRAAEIRGVEIVPIITTMPVYTPAPSPTTWSLRWLAVLGDEARDVLDDTAVKMDLDTVESVARSLDAGRWVPSGVPAPSSVEPLSKGEFALWSLLPLALLLLAAVLPRLTWMVPAALVVAALSVIAALVAPGAMATVDYRRRSAAKALRRSV